MIVIEHERTVEDLIEFSLFHVAHSPSFQRQILSWQIAMALLTTILSLSVNYLLYRQFAFTPIPFIVSILAGALVFFIYPYLNRKSMIGRLKQMLSEGNNKTMLGNQVITTSPEGIFCKSQAGESKLNWSSIDKVMQNEKYIFLYISSTNAFVIPTNAFATENQRQEFLSYIKAHMEHKIESGQPTAS